MAKDGGGYASRHSGRHSSPSLYALFISLIFPLCHFPLSALMILSDRHYMFHFSTPPQPLVCSLCAPFTCLSNLLLSAIPLPPRWDLITLTIPDAVCLPLFEGQVQGLGEHPTSFPHRSQKKTSSQGIKKKITKLELQLE